MDTPTTASPFTIRAFENLEPWAAYDELRAKGPLVWDDGLVVTLAPGTEF